MSSKRPKKIKTNRGSITLPPELAAHYLRTAAQGSDDAEVKALMSMFVELMSMSPDEKKSMSFSFSTGSSSSWPPNAAAAAASMFASSDADGQWSFDYYNEEDEDSEEEETDNVANLKRDSETNASTEETDAGAVAEAIARQIAQDEEAAEEEREKKAAKKREKKQRKKAKAKQEAVLKAQEAEQKKRAKQIQSWKSRVVAACQSKEDYKIQGLLAESPLGKQSDEDVTLHLEFLLPHCIARSGRNEGNEACQKLAAHVIGLSLSVAFSIGRNGRSALHTACFVGDCYFVKLVTDNADEDSPLNLLCKDSGWTPLHYAVAAACPEAMEELLLVGCNVDVRTDESLTCRTSDGQGITVRELAEIIASGNQDDEIETQGVAVGEAMEHFASSRSEKKRYLGVLKTMVVRLKDVEENGYEPPSPKAPERLEAKEDEETKPQKLPTNDDASKRKQKKKKKQVKPEQSQVSTASHVSSNATNVKAPVELKVDPLVTALLGMGFTEEQIYAAAKACGGLERATADEMVMWILGGGEESPQPAALTDRTDESQETAFIPTSRNNPESTSAKKLAQQPAASLTRAQKENAEAVKREEDARARAERLAAKREEQRRRNREWNNRAQVRQKEEMELRAQKEAIRVAKERAAAQQQGSAGPVLTGQARVAQAPPPTQILQRPSHMPVGGVPAGMVFSKATGTPATASEANMMGYTGQGYSEGGINAAYVSSANSVSSTGSGRHSMSAQYVSSANSVSSAGSGRHSMTAQYVSSGNSVTSFGSGMQSTGMLHQSQQPMYGYPTSNVPLPGFQSFGGAPSISTGSSYLHSSSAEVTSAVSYEENSSGEIRATAKTFVPVRFKSTPASQGGSSTTPSAPQSVPPGMELPPTAHQNPPALSDEDPLANILSAAVPGMAPPGMGGAEPAKDSTSVEDPSLNELIGSSLNQAPNQSSLLGSLSLPPTSESVDDAAVSSIWGDTSLPQEQSLAGIAASGTDKASGDHAGLWKSGLSQPGTSRLGSIW